MASTPTYSIAPGAIAQPSETGGPGFALSNSQWLLIQTLVIDALALPTSMDEFKNLLGPGAPSDLTDFDDLLNAYRVINSQCSTWQETTFPSSVALAGDVYNYGVNKAPIYYAAINKEAAILSTDPSNAEAAAALKGMLGVLQSYAITSQASATAVKTAIQAFADQIQESQLTLVGPNGDAGLVKRYNDKYGAASELQTQLNEEISANEHALSADQARYNHDVIVATTTPTYGWIWPVGTIAAAIVAGIYGHDAVKALDDIKADHDRILAESAQLAADQAVIDATKIALKGVTGISTAIAAALPVIQTIEGVWGAIAQDLGAISTLIDLDIRQAAPIIMNLGVSEAITAWYNVAQAANSYRVNAYVTVPTVMPTTPTSTSGVVSMEAWRVHRLLASPAVRGI